MQQRISWNSETRLISDLSPYPKNARCLTEQDAFHLQTSIKKFGLIDKPVINIDNQIIGGHQRLEILKRMGFTEIEVLVPDRRLESFEVEELNIRLNKNTGDWDWDKLANEFEVTDLLEWGFSTSDLGLGKIGELKEEEEEKKEEELCPTCNQKIKR
jgi:ParB-like chromosome segregation protein Spo0J